MWINSLFITLSFLSLQAMIAFTALEIAVRYWKWWKATPSSTDLVIRSVLLGVAVANLGLGLLELNWMAARFTEHHALNILYDSAPQVYFRADVASAMVWVGLVIHLVPLWRLVYKMNWWEVCIAAAARAGIASVLYVGSLIGAGLFWCYVDLACV